MENTVQESLRYSVMIDGRDAIESATLKDAIFHAKSATLNAEERVEVYDWEEEKVVEIFYPED